MSLVLCLIGDVTPPAKHRADHHGGTNNQQPIAVLVHYQQRAAGHDERRHGANQRPRARIYQVVGVGLFVGV